jgi:hypothetical protein
LGKIQVTVILLGMKGISSNESFDLTVYAPPRFDSSLPKKLDLMASTISSFKLPIPNENYYVVHNFLLSFAKFDYSTNSYTFLPD